MYDGKYEAGIMANMRLIWCQTDGKYEVGIVAKYDGKYEVSNNKSLRAKYKAKI